MLTGDSAASTTFADSGAQWYRARNEPLQAARLLRGKGNALWRTESVSEAEAAFLQSLVISDGLMTAETIGTLTELATLTATSLLKSDEGIALAERALAGAIELGRTDLEAVANRTIGNSNT